jgi:hypothetical protein
LISRLCAVGAAGGLVLMAVGLAWPAIGGGRMLYSETQAKEYQDASAALHAATSGHVHADREPHDHASRPPVGPAEREAQVAAARERFQQAEAKLETARFAQNSLGHWFTGVGLAAAIAFGIGYGLSQRAV